MRHFIKSMCDDYTTIYERATYLEAVRFARELRSKHGARVFVYTDKGDASMWDKTTWAEFYVDLIREVLDD